MIFVMVGTHLKPFNRLLKKIDELIENGVIKEEVIAQFGSSDYKIKNYNGKPFFDKKERIKLIANANFVITHGGAGCIIDSLLAGKPTIVVPRLKKFDEHTNDHQLEITEAFGSTGKIIPVYDIDELAGALKSAKMIIHIKRNTELANKLSTYIKGIEVMK